MRNALLDVVLEPVVRTMNDEVYRIRCSSRTTELRSNLVEPLRKALLWTRVERRKRSDHAGPALSKHQVELQANRFVTPADGRAEAERFRRRRCAGSASALKSRGDDRFPRPPRCDRPDVIVQAAGFRVSDNAPFRPLRFRAAHEGTRSFPLAGRRREPPPSPSSTHRSTRAEDHSQARGRMRRQEPAQRRPAFSSHRTLARYRKRSPGPIRRFDRDYGHPNATVSWYPAGRHVSFCPFDNRRASTLAVARSRQVWGTWFFDRVSRMMKAVFVVGILFTRGLRFSIVCDVSHC